MEWLYKYIYFFLPKSSHNSTLHFYSCFAYFLICTCSKVTKQISVGVALEIEPKKYCHNSSLKKGGNYLGCLIPYKNICVYLGYLYLSVTKKKESKGKYVFMCRTCYVFQLYDDSDNLYSYEDFSANNITPVGI